MNISTFHFINSLKVLIGLFPCYLAEGRGRRGRGKEEREVGMGCKSSSNTEKLPLKAEEPESFGEHERFRGTRDKMVQFIPRLPGLNYGPQSELN